LFQYYTRTRLRGGDKHKRRGGKEDEKIAGSEAWASNEAPKRIGGLLTSNQEIRRDGLQKK
jgi:hypothetical protein